MMSSILSDMYTFLSLIRVGSFRPPKTMRHQKSFLSDGVVHIGGRVRNSKDGLSFVCVSCVSQCLNWSSSSITKYPEPIRGLDLGFRLIRIGKSGRTPGSVASNKWKTHPPHTQHIEKQTTNKRIAGVECLLFFAMYHVGIELKEKGKKMSVKGKRERESHIHIES